MSVFNLVPNRPIEEKVRCIAEILQSRTAWHPIALRQEQMLAGWAGLDLPERVGGAAWAAVQMVELFRQCGRLDLELRDLVGGGHARLLTLVSTRKFDPLLRSVVTGAAYCAVAITEPEVGSDLQALGTTATPIEGGYRLRGTKQHVARIAECTHIIVFASIKRQGAPVLITAFLVPRDTKGVLTEDMSPMGMNTVSWGRVHLRDVDIAATARIGGEGQAIALFLRHFSYWRCMMAAAALGSAQWAVDQAVQRMKSREAFGGPIGRFTHLQQALASHTARLRMAWLLAERVVTEIDQHHLAAFDAAMAKAESVEAAVAATEWSMSIFGAAGYDAATGIEKRYRDLLGLRVADGTTDVLRGQVARAILGERMYELSLNRKPVDAPTSDAPRRFFW